MNRIIGKVIEIDARNVDELLRRPSISTRSSSARWARRNARRNTSASRPCWPRKSSSSRSFKARASHAAQVQSRVKKLDKIETRRGAAPSPVGAVRVPAAPPRSGDDVISLRNVHKGYGAQPIYEGLDFLRLRRKERWCVLGANGAGKSTLLKLVAGDTKPDRGQRSISAPASRWAISPSTPWTCWTAKRRSSSRWSGSFPQAGHRGA